MAGFDSIVQLCRAAETANRVGSDLVINLYKSELTSSLYNAIDAAGWPMTLRVDGQEVTYALDRVADRKAVVLVIHGMVRTAEIFANNINQLLEYDGGRFLGEMPSNFYLIQENYASGEVPVHQVVQQYARVIRIIDVVKKVADDVRESPGTAGHVVFITSRKVDFPIIYKQWDLERVANDEEIDLAIIDIFSDHHESAREDIARRAVVRLLSGVAKEDRFSSLVRSFGLFRETVLADFDIYASGLNFDKVRDDFERKKLDYVIKLNAIGADAMGKMILIPVGQALLASQMKHEAVMAVANTALLTASFIFAVIAMMIIASYWMSINQVKHELRAEVVLVKTQSHPTYMKLKSVIDGLRVRINVHLWCVPIVLFSLIFVTTVMTWHAYSAIVVIQQVTR